MAHRADRIRRGVQIVTGGGYDRSHGEVGVEREHVHGARRQLVADDDGRGEGAAGGAVDAEGAVAANEKSDMVTKSR